MIVTTNPNAVFYSYRGVKSNPLVTRFIDMLNQKGIPHKGCESGIIEDTLTDFEETIGVSNIIVIFYNQDYFKSDHCMNEYANIRKYENDIRKETTYYVKCANYDIDELISFWGSKRAVYENKNKLTEIEQRSLDNRCYLDTTTTYCVQNLDDYFSSKIHYKEDTLPTLVNLIAEKYHELSSRNTTSSQSVTTSSAPSFRIPTTQTKLVKRDNLVGELHELVSNNNFANLYGFGGSGKTSLVFLYLDEYRSEYNQIAYVVVNNNIKADFVSQINDTIHILKPEDEREKGLENNQKMIKDAETERNKPDRYKTVIEYLESNYKSDKPNLVILDINNADDAVKFGEELANNTLQSNKIYPDGWKYLILSRTNIYKGPATLNLNENEKDNTSFLKALFLKNAGDKYNDFSDSEFTELFNTIYYSPLMTEQLGIFLHNLPKKSLSEISDILHKDSFKKENRSGITAQNRGEEEKTIIGFLKNLIVFEKLSAGEKILLKHFILWPADYISKDVIWELLSKTFESEKNKTTKLKSIIKRYFTTWGIKRIGVFFNKTKRYAVSKLWYWILSIAIWGIILFGILGVFSQYVSVLWLKQYSIVVLSVVGVGLMLFYLLNEIDEHGCTFRSPLQNAIRLFIIALIAGGSSLIPFPLCRNVCIILVLCSPLIISLFHFCKKVVKVISSKSFLEDINQDAFTGILLELTKKGILSENEDSNKGYKLHGLIAESLREQINIPNTDYSDYLDSVKKIATYKENDFMRFAKCIGHSLGVYKIVVDNSTLFDIALDLHTSSTANYAAMLYSDIIDNTKICVYKWQRNNLASVYNNLALLQAVHLRDFDSAKANYEKAITIGEQLPKDNPEYQNRLARAYNNFANLQKDHLKDYVTAKSNYEKAIAIREQLSKDNPEYRNDLVVVYNNLAILLQEHLDDYYSAKSYFEKVITIREQLSQNDSEDHNNLVMSYNALALLQEDSLCEYASAKANYEKAILLCNQLPTDDFMYKDNLAILYNNLARLQNNHLKDYESSKSNYEKVISIREQLPKDNLEYQDSLACVYNNLALLQAVHLRDYDSAKSNFEKAITIGEQLPKDNPEYQNKLAMWCSNLANLQKIQYADYDSAKANLEKAIAIGEKLPKDNPEYQNDLADFYNKLAILQIIHFADYDSAKANLEKAIAIREQLPKDNPEYQNDLADFYNKLAILQKNHFADYDSAKANLEKAIAIREQLPKDNPEYQNDLADAYNNLANLQKDHLEDYDSAKSNYDKAIAIREQLPKDNPEYQQEMARVYYNLASLKYVHLGDYDSAKSNYEKAIAIGEQLPKDNPEYQFVLASLYNNLAILQKVHFGDYDSAKANYEKAIEIRELLPKDNPEYQNDLASSYNSLAVLQKNHLRDYDLAKANYEKEIAIREQLPKDNPKYQNELACAYYNLAHFQHIHFGDYDSAKANYEKAIAIGVLLPKDNPEYQNNLASAYNNLANLQKNHFGDYDSAKANYEKAIAIREQLPKDNPKYQNGLASAYGGLADLQCDYLGDYELSKSNYEKATAIGEQLPKDNPEYQNDLANTYNNLANLQKNHFGDYDSAKANYEKAIAIREQLPKDNPKYQNGLASAYGGLADLQCDYLGDYELSKSNYEKATAIGEQLPKDNPEYQNDLANTYNNLANLQSDHLGEYELSKSNYEKAIAIQEQLPKDNPLYQNNLAIWYNNLANLQQIQLGDYELSKSNYEKAIEIRKQLPKDNPEYQNGLADSYNGLAYTYDKLKEYDKAIESINTAIDIASKLKETDSKYLIDWLNCRHSLADIKYNNGKDLDEVKNTLLEIQPLAQQCLKDNPNDKSTKTVNDAISALLSKIE